MKPGTMTFLISMGIGKLPPHQIILEAIFNFMVDVEHVFCYNVFINTIRKKKNTCLKPV